MTQTIGSVAPVAASPQEQILDMIIGLMKSRAVVIAAELELADHLVSAPLHVDVLASRTNTHAPSLFRLMRALESLGIFAQVSPRTFANTPTSECLRKSVPGSQWALLRGWSTGGGLYEAWAGLRGSVETGHIAFDQMYGYSLWEFFGRNPERGAIFNEMIRSFSVAMTPAVTASYDWSRFAVIADIGGGIGAQLVDILDSHLSCRGILFDQPDVVAGAIPHDRVERIGGSIFDQLPAGADLYLLRWVVHDWAEPKAIAILKNVRKAMNPDSRVALVESIMPEATEPGLGNWMDLNMLTCVGGRERTAAEYRELYEQTGFGLEEIVTTPCPASIIIGRPQN